jgi:predicted RNA binding protein YcfA (HicA-like mRNA interferase family)
LPKLKRLSGQQVCRILERNEFARVRQKGSHIVMQRRTGETTTTVPVPDHKELKPGTLSSITRQSGIAREQFEE